MLNINSFLLENQLLLFARWMLRRAQRHGTAGCGSSRSSGVCKCSHQAYQQK